MEDSLRLIILIVFLYSPFVLGDDSDNYGNKQVRKMLSDRPEMNKVISSDGLTREILPEDSVWKWVASAYENKVIGCRIEWNNGKVRNYSLAEHVMPGNYPVGQIKVSQKFRDKHGIIRKPNFEELWAGCVFELINIQNGRFFLENMYKALQGKITRKEWIHQNTELEYNSLIKLKDFFQSVWKPWAEKNNFKYNYHIWRSKIPDDYQIWLSQYKGKNNAYNYWAEYYDNIILPLRYKIYKIKGCPETGL